VSALPGNGPIDPLSGGRDTLFIGLDLKDPYSHLAVPGAVALAAAATQRVRWFALARPAITRATAVAGTERSAAHKQHRFRYREQELRFYAEAMGRSLAALYQDPAPECFASVLLWVQDHAPAQLAAAIEAAFAAHWECRINAEAPADWAQCLDDAVPGAQLGARWLEACVTGESLTPETLARVRAQAELLSTAGLFNTPAFIFDGEVFYGRGHLPLLKRRLAG
jgi:2-hydroxychromene-2-carboxylate isomerase